MKTFFEQTISLSKHFLFWAIIDIFELSVLCNIKKKSFYWYIQLHFTPADLFYAYHHQKKKKIYIYLRIYTHLKLNLSKLANQEMHF